MLPFLVVGGCTIVSLLLLMLLVQPTGIRHPDSQIYYESHARFIYSACLTAIQVVYFAVKAPAK